MIHPTNALEKAPCVPCSAGLTPPHFLGQFTCGRGLPYSSLPASPALPPFFPLRPRTATERRRIAIRRISCSSSPTTWVGPTSGCYGGEIPTPHIDSLAAGGVRFTQFYNNAICGPTRASLLTGLYCQQVGHRGDRWNEPKDFRRCVTIGEVLQQAGYRTMLVGKWQGRDLAVKRGFDRAFGPMCQGKISYFHEVQLNGFYLDDRRWNVPDDFFMTEAFSDHAVQFVEEAGRDERPFFLYMAYIAPHWPLHAREADIARFRAMYRERGWDDCRRQRFIRQREEGLIPQQWELSTRPSNIGDWQRDRHKDWQAERMAVYAAQVAGIDRGVGRILDAVRKTGREDNTLVMFLSDNGAAPRWRACTIDQRFRIQPEPPQRHLAH